MSTQRTEAEAEVQLGTFFEDAKAYVVARATSGSLVGGQTADQGSTVWSATDPSLRASRFSGSLLRGTGGQYFVMDVSEPRGPNGGILVRELGQNSTATEVLPDASASAFQSVWPACFSTGTTRRPVRIPGSEITVEIEPVWSESAPPEFRLILDGQPDVIGLQELLGSYLEAAVPWLLPATSTAPTVNTARQVRARLSPGAFTDVLRAFSFHESATDQATRPMSSWATWQPC